MPFVESISRACQVQVNLSHSMVRTSRQREDCHNPNQGNGHQVQKCESHDEAVEKCRIQVLTLWVVDESKKWAASVPEKRLKCC
jgi:hypothetical protein